MRVWVSVGGRGYWRSFCHCANALKGDSAHLAPASWYFYSLTSEASNLLCHPLQAPCTASYLDQSNWLSDAPMHLQNHKGFFFLNSVSSSSQGLYYNDRKLTNILTHPFVSEILLIWGPGILWRFELFRVYCGDTRPRGNLATLCSSHLLTSPRVCVSACTGAMKVK